MASVRTYSTNDTKKDFEMWLNACSPDSESERWVIGGKNRYCHRENYGTMLKRYDKVAFEAAYKEWKENR